MSLISRIFTGPPKEERILTSANFGLPWNSYESTGDEDFSRGGAMSLTTFFACVRLLADAVSSLPITALKTNGLVPIPVKPQPALLSNLPYPKMTWQSWLWMLMESLAVTGNAYLWITARDDRNRATALMPVHPRFVTVELPNADIMEWPDPIYHINGKAVPSEDLVHIKRFPVAGSVLGMSPVHKAASAIGLSLHAEEYGRRWFKDSANPSGILTTKEDLSELQAKMTLKRWVQGNRNRRMPAVLGSGMTWQPISITPEESQFLATRQFQRAEIAMWFGIPPHMIGDTEKSTSWGEGIDAQKDGFLTFTLEPWLNCIEQALSLLLPRGQEAKFDLDAIMRGDSAKRWQTYLIGRNTGAYSVNDILIMEGRPPIGPEGDIRLQPMNYVPLGTPVSEYLGAGPSSDDPNSGEDDDPPAAAARKVPA